MNYFLKPNDTLEVSFRIPFKELQNNFTNVHFNFIYESEKGGYYDRYLILTLERQVGEPKEITIIKSINIDVFGETKYNVRYITTEQVSYILRKSRYFPHTYLSDEMYKIEKLF